MTQISPPNMALLGSPLTSPHNEGAPAVLEFSKAHVYLVGIEVANAKEFQDEMNDYAHYDEKTRDQQAEQAANENIQDDKHELEVILASDCETRKKNRAANRHKREKSVAATLLDDLGLDLDALLFYVLDDKDVQYSSLDPLHLALTNVLQSGLTMVYAIALLLENGYVVDADARWRGLYELTCQVAVLSKAADVEDAALRYLMHGQESSPPEQLMEKDRTRGEAMVQQELNRGQPEPDPSTGRQGPPYWERDYQWIPAELLKNGLQQKRITQAELFTIADLNAAPASLVKDSHMSVHMSTRVVASTRTVSRNLDPGGYSAEMEAAVGERTAKTVYELVAHCCVLAGHLNPDKLSYAAWEQAFYQRVRSVVEKLS